MDSFTYSSARQNLSRLLDIAQKQGEGRKEYGRPG
jgi:hypothetical protein